MNTILQNFGNINKNEATLLIEKYSDLIEDLEDYLSIKKHNSGKTKFLDENQTKELFDSLIK